MTFAEAGIVAVVCMAIVFGMLALIAGIISLFKFVSPKEQAKPVVKQQAPQVQAARPALKLEDIKDEDMMAAALVATIDYHEETKEDVRVVSIKQIG
jgi:Na+-transporting methylmalonyl-CoA/oxaloacetate decarboxylase gamma subunit